MRKFIIAFFLAVFAAGAVFAGAAVYVNGGVSDYNPTIGFNAEGQLGHASVIGGIGSMTYNNMGWATGVKFYLFGVDGGPYLGAAYGATGVKANTHKDGDTTIIDSTTVFTGFSALAGYRFFFADGWNINFGAGASRADNSTLVTMDITAGFMLFADDEARKNAEKYRKSYEPEPEIDEAKTEMPEPGEGVVEVKPPEKMEEEQAKAEAVTVTAEPVTATAAPEASAKAEAVPQGETGTAGEK